MKMRTMTPSWASGCAIACSMTPTKNSYNTGSSTQSPALVSPAQNESFFVHSSWTETNRYSCALRERCVVWPMTRTPML